MSLRLLLQALVTTVFVGLVASIFQASAADQISATPDISNEDCLECHEEEPDDDTPRVTAASVEASIHDGLDCMECHVDILDLPHREVLDPAACGDCHEDVAEVYTQHGLGLVGTDPDLPTCAGCHGSHDIHAIDDPESMTHAAQPRQVCAQCHGDIDWVKDHNIRLHRVVDSYESSVHGQALLTNGNSLAAVCSDCHGVEQDVHRILPAGDNLSAINHFNIPGTCGKCHKEEEDAFWDGIHGQMALRGDTHVPICTDCHGEHGILAPDDPRSNVSAVRVAEATCTPCHEAARINERYDAPLGSTKQFVDSFHGLKSGSGDATVANCSSCHAPHRTLPSTDIRSQVHPRNLQKTCGSCHEGISPEMAQVSIHSAADEAGWPFFFRRVYIALIVLVIGGMFAYVALDFVRQSRRNLSAPQVKRMDRDAIVQHTLLMATFIVLVLTGFALRYSEYFPFRQMFGWDGGFHSRGIVHRVAAAIFTISSLWHLVWMFLPKGRAFVAAMSPGARDIREFIHAVRFNLGLTKKHPLFGKFSFVEKAEYWALVWGTVIMALSGFLLWFRNDTLDFISREFLQVMRVIHLYEAWLATLAILVWHLYAVIFKPGVYPGNPSWVTGKMPREMYVEEHGGEAGAVEMSRVAQSENRTVAVSDTERERRA